MLNALNAYKSTWKYAVLGYMMDYECATLSHIQQTGLSPVRSLADNLIEQFCTTQQKEMDV